MIQRRPALTLAVLLVVVLAGCSSGGPATTTATTTDAATTAETTTAETTTAETTTRTTGTTVRPADVPASQVQRDAVAAMEAVDAYRIVGATERRLSGNNVDQTVTIRTRGAFDRSARRLRINQSVAGPAGTATVLTYVVDRNLYQRSDVFVQQYGSAWVSQNLSANFSTVWNFQDTMTRQRALLANGTPTGVGRTTVDGTEAYVLRVDADESVLNDDLERQLGSTSNVTITDASFVLWVATEDARPLFSRTVVNSTGTARGSTVEVDQVLSISFATRDVSVSVSLPPGARTAVSLANATAGTGARVETPSFDADE